MLIILYMGKYELLATTSLMFNVGAFSHLIYHIYQTKNTSTFTYTYILSNIFAQLLLIVYGIANKAYGIYGPTIILTIGLFYVLYAKITYPEKPGASANNTQNIKDTSV